MAKVTSKLQVTVPKALAVRYGIRPGAELVFREAGDAIRVEVGGRTGESPLPLEDRLELFDESWKRQLRRQRKRARGRPPRSRGWTREDLYGDRGRPR